jgi:uncharacterized protein (TIGR02284 family)
MESNEMIKKLSSLVQLDIDAIHAYDQALEKIDFPVIHKQLTRFKSDHQRHVESLSDAIRRFGGEPPTFSPDFKGFLIQGFTALRSISGTEGALKAMKTNEMLTNSTYDDALSWDFPSDVREIIVRNREDERQHLQYIERAIEDRTWDTKKEVA